MPKIEQNARWSCKYCTYDNFPASTKCTLCNSKRVDSCLNEDSMDSIDGEAAPEDEKNNCSETSDQADLLQGRWACLSCTYLNWENSLKCVMCTNERPNDFLPQATTIDSLAKNQADDLTVNNNEKNRVISKSKPKWTCPQCTFENWNKSKKCSLCSFQKWKPDESAILKTKNSHNVLNLKNSRQRSRPSAGKSVAAAIQPITSEDEEQLIYGLSATSISAVSKQYEIKNNLQESDWMWLSACIGVVEGEPSSVKLFLSSGGSAARKLTPNEVLVLNRPGVFEVGDTLVHLSIRYHRDDLLAIMLPHDHVSRKTFKRMPCHVSPDLAASVRKQAMQGLRQRKGDWPCYFYTDLVTFTLPGELQDLPGAVQQYALEEVVDQNAQRVLELESIINWSVEITNQLDSRVYALWNRSAGDCLLDSICQATWGIFDRENALRNALYVSLSEGASRFFPRWKEWEEMQATNMQFTLDEDQWEQDWASVLSLASQPGASLEQMHVFALAHIIRRPIIIYGVKFVRSFRGETLGLARFQGVYLPLLWEKGFCWKSPIVLGYTRGHFSALVAMETEQHGAVGAGAHTDNSDESHVTYLPLVDHECKLLPVHFLNATELGNEDQLLREWLDCHITNAGVLVAEQKATPSSALVSQLMDEWLDRYRKMNKEMVSERRKR
ncbi:ubiquitin thioesterase ZRANB1-like [Dendronephthya gigantea]|uniref:ubiquitin thioesterase ZRANB1-like n=1 Tax=Dendronephthya gigantea TaxID=151771 RepID=UPI001069AA9B|nr:ubiquitin thioesterase ZRANB1-like [Dendronephthya gigantea]